MSNNQDFPTAQPTETPPGDEGKPDNPGVSSAVAAQETDTAEQASSSQPAPPSPSPSQPPPAPPPDESIAALEERIATLEERIATLEKEKRETYDRLLRSAADLDNLRKRTRKEIEEIRVRSQEELLREILPVIDNLERALTASATGEPQGLVEGVRLVHRQFQNVLERFGVKPFVSFGVPFDPTHHEAIAQVVTAEMPPGMVYSEAQKGYLIGERLLRPALVSVAKAPPPPPAPAPSAELPQHEAGTAPAEQAEASVATEASVAKTQPESAEGTDTETAPAEHAGVGKPDGRAPA
ncbi:MAG: nucleotide exchange factor GrpE [Pseudomonadota bacterium]